MSSSKYKENEKRETVSRKNPAFCVVIPAYNEETTITKVLKDVFVSSETVVVVNDGSTDRTMDKALEFPITLLSHPINLGAGAAMQTGFDYACTLPVDYVVTIDSDGQHEPSEIPHLVEICRNGYFDVVLGSRFMQGAAVVNIGRFRRVILKAATIFTRLATGLKVSDTHNSLRVFTRTSAAKIHMKQNGYAHSSELLSQIAKEKLKYTEAPVTVRYTEYSMKKGQSTWNLINILWDMISEKIK
jgi:glycosyltransferase involved in cell wall biosynthesis